VSVVAFSRYQLGNVPEALRLLAHEIETGEVDAEYAVVAMQLKNGYGDYRVFGPDPFSRALAVGVLTFAVHSIVDHR